MRLVRPHRRALFTRGIDVVFLEPLNKVLPLVSGCVRLFRWTNDIILHHLVFEIRIIALAPPNGSGWSERNRSSRSSGIDAIV
jgi:hypothetical protein